MKNKFQSKSVPRGTRTIWRYLGALFILFTFAIGNVWGANPYYASQDWGSDDFSSVVANHTNVVITSSATAFSGNLSEKYYIQCGSSSGITSGYMRFAATEQIDSVSIFFIGNSTTAAGISWCGWGKNVTPSVEVGSNYGSTATFAYSAKNYANARWMTIDVSDKNLYTLQIFRQGKNLTKNGNKISNFGANQTINILGIKVWLHPAAVTKYTITYAKGEYGTGDAIANGEKTKDVAFTLSSSTYSRENYTQQGWSTTDGGAKAYDLGGSYTANADITLYPFWVSSAAATHDISYTNTKGATNSNPAKYTEGVGVASFEPLADVTDFHFTGWSPASISTTATDDQTIEAQWVAAYDVTFSAGAGSGTVPASFQKWEGAKFNLPGQGSMIAPAGKAFDGWKANGTGAKLAANAEYTMGNAAVEFVAQWKAVAQTIFDWTFANNSDISSDKTDLSNATYGTMTTGTSILGRIFGSTSIAKNSSGYKLQSADACFEIQGTYDFMEGDTIKISVKGGGSGERGLAITPSTASGVTEDALVTSMVDGSVNGVCTAILTSTEEGAKIRVFQYNGKNMYIKNIKVIRPAARDIATTEITLSDLKVNNHSISSDSLAILTTAPAYALTLKDEYVTAPEIKFNEHKVITYADELLPATKETDKVYTVTATLVDGNWQAQATINAITYTVTAPKQSSAKVTYYDGTTKLGEEVVAIGDAPADYADFQGKDYATFVGWYSNPDLADGHLIADITALTISANTNVYGKWAPAYASSINIEQWVLDNGVSNSPFRAELTARHYKYATLNNLDSLNDDPSKDYRNYAYLGQKVNKTDSEISFLLKTGSTLNVRFGHIGTPLNVVIGSAEPVELTSAEYANDAPGDKKYTYTATEDVIVKFQTTGTSTCVFKQIMIDEEIQNVILPAIVTLDANGGTYTDESVKYTGTPLVIGDATPADEYQVFAGWFDGDDQIDATAYVPTKNVTLQAHYAPKTYSITYMPNGATTSVEYIVDDDATVVLGCPAQFTAPANTKFDGWNTDPAGNGDAYAAGDAVTENLTLHAQWQSYFTITYMDGETELDTEDVLEGDAPVGIADPVKAMNIFQGWTLSGSDEVIDFATLTSSTTVYAKWEVIDACFYYLPTKPAEAVQLAVDALVPGANGGSMKVLGDKIFNSPYGLSFENSGTAAVLVTLDKNMEAATVIKANVVVNPKEDNARGLLLRNAANSATVQEWTFVPAQNPDTLEFTYTVQAGDGLAGTNQFCIKRSTNAWLISLMVSNCAPEQFTVTYKDGEATLGTEGVYENEHPTADGINTHKKGYEFQGWAETVDGAVVDLNDITITAAKNLFAQYTVMDCSPKGVKFSMVPQPNELTSDYQLTGTTEQLIGEYATVTGGVVYLNNNNSSNRVRITKTTSTIQLVSGDDGYIHVELDCPLKENDSIKFDNSERLVLAHNASKTSSVNIAKTDHFYIVPTSWEGKYDFYIWRTGTGCTISGIEVVRPEIYTVSFNMMGHGSDIADITGVVKGSKIAAPTAPTDEDYAFAGWYKENTLSNAWDFDNDVVTANTILYAKWLDMTDATLKSLKYGATDIALQDGVYEYNVELPSYTTAVPALTAETSNPNASAVVADDAAFDESGNAQSTVTVTPQKVGADQQVYIVNFTHAAALPQVDVTGTTVWDFTNGNAAASKITLNYVDVVLANVAGVKTENINAQALLVNANYISNAQLQAKTIMFRTTVPGQLTIRYGCTSGKGEGNERTLYINDLPTTSATYGTDMVEYKQIVPAGEVTIKAMYGETPTVDIMNYRYIEFKTADYTRNVSNNIGTLCVDHNVLVGGALGATFYQIASRNELYNDKIDFEEVLPNEELKAGEPYIFQSTTGRIDLFFGTTVADEPVAVRGMIGNYAASTLAIDEDNQHTILYIAENKLWSCENIVGSTLKLNPNRAYINMELVPTYAEYQEAQTSNPAPRRRVTLGKDAEQVVTGVENLNASEQPVKLLINGQIFILRGEKMFDATGRLVK